MTRFLLIFLLTCGCQSAFAQYPRYDALLRPFQDARVSITKYGTSSEGRPLQVLTLTTGQRPAVCVIAGVDKTSMAGGQIATQIALQFAQVDSLKRLLNDFTLYVIPVADPDAYEAYFRRPLDAQERIGPPDDPDHDGLQDEDPVNDLDGDGFITQMRVADPAGEWLPHPDDPRVLRNADPAKRERGRWRLLTEGVDDDQDGKFNEDGVGSAAFNRNFPYAFEWFTDGAGAEALALPEARALAEWLFQHPEIHVVYVLGPDNNLSQPWKFDAGASNQQIPAAPLKKDGPVFAQLSTSYLDVFKGAKDLPVAAPTKGGLMTWVYYHYGRFVAGAPAWQAPKNTYKADTTLPDSVRKKLKARAESDHAEVAFHFRAEKLGLGSYFAPWRPVAHPDFPNQVVEVGGLIPLRMNEPPSDTLVELASLQAKFVAGLGGQLPRIAVTGLKTTVVAPGLTRVEIKVLNDGFLPTHSEVAGKIKYCVKNTVALTLPSSAQLRSGLKLHKLQPLGPGESVTLTWLVQGVGPMNIRAGAPQAGFVETSVELR